MSSHAVFSSYIGTPSSAQIEEARARRGRRRLSTFVPGETLTIDVDELVPLDE